MAKQMVKGRIPVSQKPAQKRITAEEIFGGGTFEIPDHIKADMKAKGWEPRWLNAQEVYKNQGYHKKQWKVYKDTAPAIAMDFLGKDPEGLVRRGDCILGYKEAEAHKKHKMYLRQMAGEEDNKRSRQKEELQTLAASLGVNTEVDDSDDE